MNGSGLGNFGLAGAGQRMANFYGQQPWAEEARRNLYSEAYARSMAAGGAGMPTEAPMRQLEAMNYASSFLPRGATLGGGMTSGFGMPSAGMNVPSSVSGGMGSQAGSDWWRRMPQYQFPMMR